MAELADLKSYDEDISKALDKLERGIEQLYTKKSPERHSTHLESLKSTSKTVQGDIRAFKSELKDSPKSISSSFNAKLVDYENRMKSILETLSSAQQNGGSDQGSASANLREASRIQDSSAASVDRSKNKLNAMVEMARGTHAELKQQGNTIERQNHSLDDVNDDIKASNKQITSIQRSSSSCCIS
eukprot:TRINITY_DN12126_c0_g1_i1.p2 TRINITY_DN12126_c0_g1~~TRINITY_DN12126_c0_g1_i1.p2  ORF type:complete len:186 (-),score=31.76 TRINITY_DN12126_c0_g1_i1:1989-2546(-)